MSPRKIITIQDARISPQELIVPRSAAVLPKTTATRNTPWTDRRDRPLRDLRISVTDRCNFRCSYCMPKEVFDKEHRFLPHASLLSFEEITRLARILVAQGGVRKIRLTGGEPLLRRHIENLIGMLAELRTPEGDALDLTITTNASLLARKAESLKAAGLQRVTVSLDALDDAVFRRMNDVDFPVADVMDGIDAALAAGLGPIKINMVVKGGTNDDQIVPMVRYFRERHGSNVTLRFIEYMDVGSSNGWRMDEVMASAEVIRRISAVYPLHPIAASQTGETASRWAFADGCGEVGVISSVTQAFCHDCNRLRLSTDGHLYTCLFATQGHDVRFMLRNDPDDDRLAAVIAHLWQQRDDHYSELRQAHPSQPAQSTDGSTDPTEPSSRRRIEMSYIGG
ncbi:GTP 3',8-cyclase MoaA [Leptothrix ochracea]|uniref:GTP 3',8-cyclase MoaA n=1 Tax=Leptothrix ochracea TaxID=735331 RepID=UPI0034E1A484